MPAKLGYENGLITGFVPKFRSLDQDQERYLFVLVDLADAGVIVKKKGETLLTHYADKGYDWLREEYFRAGKLDEIERHYMADDFTAFALPHEATQEVIDRFAAMGQTERARRLWRSHVGQLRGRYWEDVSLSREAPVPMLDDGAADVERRHAEWLERIEERRGVLIGVIGACIDWLAALPGGAEATAREIARLEVARAEAESGVRQRPEGKPDPRAMDEALFWEIVEAGLGEESEAERVDMLAERLARFKPAAIRKFAELLRDKDDAAYRSDVWALAYLLRGGCSDDAFDGFRGWLILQGRATYEGALADPDAFDAARFDDHEIMGLMGAAEIAYEMRAGKTMRVLKARTRSLGGPELNEEDFAACLPKVAAQMEAR